jgi:gliding motility-associated-like protein
MKNLILLLFLLISALSQATHLVGGDVTYSYKGNGVYDLYFTIYRDCQNGVPPYDGIAGSSISFYFGIIQVSNPNNKVYDTISITAADTSEIYNTNTNACLIDTTYPCLSKAVYRKTITIPDTNNAYYIVYQRCCRNNDILNIVPDNPPPNIKQPGSTYLTRIPPTSIFHNNSAVFNIFPPKFVCLNTPFQFNLSANDKDGDSLSYELYAPYVGLNNSASTPTPTPDTIPVNWLAPYSLSNLMGGVPVAIDQNGILTGKPDTKGMFVLGIRVIEWRNGVKVGFTNRDFQFNVKECDAATPYVPPIPGSIDPMTSIGFFEINCDSFKIKFKNQSQFADTYKWKFGEPSSGANDSSALFEPSHTYADTGIYMVSLYAKKGAGCGTTYFIKVAIYPEFKAGYISYNACLDSMAVFLDSSNHKYSTVNKWSWDFGDSKSSNIKNPSHKYATAGDYQVKLTVQTNKGCVKNITKPVTIYPDPITNFDLPSPSCIYSTLSFVNTSSIASGYSIDSFFWEMDAWNTTLTNPNYIFNTIGSKPIKLTAKSNKGCYEPITKNLFINPLPVIATSPDPTICWDGSVAISVSGGVSYIWSPSAGLRDTDKTNTIATPQTYPTPKRYFVIGKDANQCVNVDSITISYFPKPIVSAGPDTSVCFGFSKNKFRDSVQLTASGAMSYSWSPGLGLSNSSIYNPLSKPKKNTNYIVTGTDINLCKVKDTMTVIVLDPSLDLIPFDDTFLCINDTIEIPILDQGEITKYLWSPNISLTNKNIRSPLFFPKATQKYYLTVSNYCYDKTDSVILNVKQLPILNMTHYAFLCSGAKFQMDANSPSICSFVWRSEPSLSSTTVRNPVASPYKHTNYYLTITDNFKCKNKDSILIEVYQKPNLAIINRPKFVCFNMPFQTDIYTELNSTWFWEQRKLNSNVWTTAIDLDFDFIKNPTIHPKDTTLYRITVTSQHGCISKDSLILRVQFPVIPIVKTPIHFCQNSFANLFASGGLYYEWSPKSSLNDPLTPTPQAYITQDKVYTVKVSNDCFFDTAKVYVYIDTVQNIKAYTDTLIYRGSSLVLEVKNANGIVEWSPNYFINDQYIHNPTVTPIYTTTYKVKLMDARGCVSEDSVIVIVKGKTVLLVPTGFSPNQDGVSDGFGVVKYLNIEKLHYLKVYNRWGEEVFSTTDINARWDGKIKGEYSDNAVFVWTVSAMTYDNEPIIQSGNVTLLR